MQVRAIATICLMGLLAASAASAQAPDCTGISTVVNTDPDLNGELAFLGVWPFCLPDQTDGFWSHRVGVPWSRKDPEALPLLHALLRGVAVRHTKAQRRTADDTPLLTLPPAGRELRMVTHGDAAQERV